MKLYDYFRSTAAYRVRIVLNMKGLAYEQVPVDLKAGAHKDAAFAQISAQQRVPVLEIDGMAIGQSGAIIDYLEDIKPDPRLLPADMLMRARVRHLAEIIACDIHPLNNVAVLAYLKGEMGADEAAVQRWYHHWITVNFAALEKELAGGTTPFAFGGAPSLFEVHLVPQFYNARRFAMPVDAYPRLLEIEAACLKLPAFIKADPHRQPDCPDDMEVP